MRGQTLIASIWVAVSRTGAVALPYSEDLMDRFDKRRPQPVSLAPASPQQRAITMLASAVLVGLLAVAARHAICGEVTGRVSVAVSRALDGLVSVDVDEVPYYRALKDIKRQSNVPIRMDTKSLTEDWLATNEPITLHVSRITLRSALILMTQAANPNLDWTIRDGAILVTTKENAEESDAEVRHDVFDLVATKLNATREKDFELDYPSLASLTMDMIESRTWPDGTGPSIISLGLDHGTSVFPQAPRVHDECEDLFVALRQVIRTRAKRLCVGPPAKVENEEGLRKAMEEKAAVDAVRTPLAKVLATLAKRHGLSIVVDPFALDERRAITAAMAEPVSLRAADITLRSALASLLRPLKLVAFVQNEVVLVTRPENIPLEVVVYWTGDLVSGKEKDGEAPWHGSRKPRRRAAPPWIAAYANGFAATVCWSAWRQQTLRRGSFRC